MKLIYLSSYDLSMEYSGVVKKIKMQTSTFEKAGISVYIPEIHNKSKFSKIFNKMPLIPTSVFIKSIVNIKDQEIRETDCVYIRKLNINGYFLLLLSRLKKINPDLKIIMEVPTYPYEQEIIGFIGKVNLIREKLFHNKLKRYLDKIVTYSKDSEIFGIPTICLSNAIDSSIITKKKIGGNSDDEINILAVAIFSFWHGYDRFLMGMEKYYENNGEKNIVLHFVGDGAELEKYRLLVREMKLESRVVFHGRKTGKELDAIFDECEIGLDAMGRHRVGVYYNSSLKGKEYGVKGLPIISGVETELDYEKDYKYYYRVKANEDFIEMDEVVEFYNKIYHSEESKEEIVNNIHEYTKSNFDVSVSLKNVIDYIKSNTD